MLTRLAGIGSVSCVRHCFWQAASFDLRIGLCKHAALRGWRITYILSGSEVTMIGKPRERDESATRK